jgi:hypothetical protein
VERSRRIENNVISLIRNLIRNKHLYKYIINQFYCFVIVFHDYKSLKHQSLNISLLFSVIPRVLNVAYKDIDFNSLSNDLSNTV